MMLERNTCLDDYYCVIRNGMPMIQLRPKITGGCKELLYWWRPSKDTRLCISPLLVWTFTDRHAMKLRNPLSALVNGINVSSGRSKKQWNIWKCSTWLFYQRIRLCTKCPEEEVTQLVVSPSPRTHIVGTRKICMPISIPPCDSWSCRSKTESDHDISAFILVG